MTPSNAWDRFARLITAAAQTRRGLWMAVACAMTCWLVSGPALAGTANAGLSGVSSTNPIADMTWGYYTGADDDIWPTYEAATGNDKQLLAEVALRPEANWFGTWVQPGAIKGVVAQYINDVTQGDSTSLAQLTDFSLAPWEGQLCRVPETPALVSAYHQWNARFAAGIGSARTLVVMQPDLPEVKNTCLSAQTRATYLQEVAWATRKLDSLQHTTVYIDAGSSDWASVAVVSRLLIHGGIQWARGFALDGTHYASTQSELSYGTQVARALAKLGYKDKHFIVDTAENGSPFNFHQLTATGSTDNVPGCQTLGHPALCQTFGIPPTWQVSLPDWQLGDHFDALAQRYADGYVWFGRPWLYAQSTDFDCELVEQMAQSTPFPYPAGASSGQQRAGTLLSANASGAGQPQTSLVSQLPVDPFCPASSLG